MAFEPSGANATVKVIIEPLVPWIWFGGLVVVLGAVVGMFHGGRRKVLAPPRRVVAPAGALSTPAADAEVIKAAS
jgi:cytochrome c biogenesis factor